MIEIKEECEIKTKIYFVSLIIISNNYISFVVIYKYKI